jgi:hypothetical protein
MMYGNFRVHLTTERTLEKRISKLFSTCKALSRTVGGAHTIIWNTLPPGYTEIVPKS